MFCSKRKKQEKGGKGLRHFSMKVCEKVQKKGVTSYNEVADELVMEFSDPRNITPTDQVQVCTPHVDWCMVLLHSCCFVFVFFFSSLLSMKSLSTASAQLYASSY